MAKPPSARRLLTEPEKPKLVHLQILRACAASLVAVDHTFGSLDFRHLPFSQYRQAAVRTGALGVAAFFVLSGFIMMRQSFDQFGSGRSALTFAYRRVSRIVPLYWIATILWVASQHYWKHAIPHLRYRLLLSYFFIPDFYSPLRSMHPLLESGWTLNYEMTFYALFTFALLFPRRWSIVIVLAIPALAAELGLLFHPAGNTRLSLLAGFYTNPNMVLFGTGVLLAFLEIKLNSLRTFIARVSPALLLALPAAVLLNRPYTIGMEPWTFSLRVFAVGIVAACALAILPKPGWFNRTLILLGDASYSTYLFHLWVYVWTIPFVIMVSARLHRQPSFRAFALVSVAAANLLGLLVYFAVERPLLHVMARVRRQLFSGRGTGLPASSTSKLST